MLDKTVGEKKEALYVDHTLDETEDQQMAETETKAAEVIKPTVTAYVGYAGFWVRFWAFIIDMIVVSSLNRVIVYPLLRWLDIPIHDAGMLSTAAISTAAVMYIYFIIMTKLVGQTLGKMVFGLKVVAETETTLTWSAVIFRELIGKFISETVFLLGYIWIGFSSKKKGWHDYFADTIVIQERKGFAVPPANAYIS